MGPVIVAAAFVLILAIGASLAIRSDVPSGMALVVRGRGGRISVHFGQRHVVPLFESAELLDISTKPIVIKRRGRNSVRCSDGVRVTARATFLVSVRATPEDVIRVRQRVSAKTLASAIERGELLGSIFEQALDVAAARVTYDELTSQRDLFCAKVHEVIGEDLDGFHLEEVSVTHLAMVPIADLDGDDPAEAPAIHALTQAAIAEKSRVAALEHEHARRVASLEHELMALLLEQERQRQVAVSGIEAESGVRLAPDKLRASLDERLRELASLASPTSE